MIRPMRQGKGFGKMDDLVKQLRGGLDNSDGGEMGGVVLTMNEAADRIEALERQVKAADALAEFLQSASACDICKLEAATALAAYRATKEGGA